MIKEIKYTSINRVLDELMRHPMLTDLTLEQAVSYTLDFIGLNGIPQLYQDKIAEVDIKDYRGLLPCDIISIQQVKDCHTGLCLRSMTDSFAGKDSGDLAFKTQGRVLFTSFPEGIVEISYKALPVDENGFPLLLDNEVYLSALKAYIKQEVFGIKYDKGDINERVLARAERDYCWKAGKLNSELLIPSINEMEGLARAWNTLIPKMREFENGFKNLGTREYLRKH